MRWPLPGHRKSDCTDCSYTETHRFTSQKFIMDVKDSNGALLTDGDSVTLIKDLKVKGSSTVLKRGTTVKKIRLTEDPAEVDCRIGGTAMVLRTEFLKKV
ncbi:zinc ribbon domain-containing protein YjdM [Fibrivirga algicola]|uniref:Alkylphosphonate utilization protein n=1 Tax=Fibrivirga algicola TaxID=2950420 RepID=A0ABX0QDU9_9BACT|nr:zinc ribbon domain-containing protein YjdM [Fibrivirga algicola]NID09426.1 alkylphosphonate utilization protein [Fibrivirga algicola]